MTATGAHVVVIGNEKGGDDEAGHLSSLFFDKGIYGI